MIHILKILNHFGTEYPRILDTIIDSSILYYSKFEGNSEIQINNFFFMCKEWAFSRDIEIRSFKTKNIDGEVYYLDIPSKMYRTFKSNSEQQAVLMLVNGF